MNKNRYKIIGLLIAATIIAIVFKHYNLSLYLSIDGFNRYHQQILDFEQNHLLEFTFVYIISYIALIACCIPGTILFDLLAGFIYGPTIGFLLVIICYLIGAIVNFLLVRYLLHDLLHKRFSHLKYLIMSGNGGMKRAAYNLIALRFIPVIPFWVLNILAAVLGIPFSVFALTTFVGIIPSSLIWVLIGDGVRSHMAEHQMLTTEIFTDLRLWAPLVVLTLMVMIPNLIKIYRNKNKK
jgi:uncharacterized membrane protein YdjX (TVP38/TMEM64 family)